MNSARTWVLGNLGPHEAGSTVWFAHCVCRARVKGQRIDIERWSHFVTRNRHNIVGPSPALAGAAVNAAGVADDCPKLIRS